jgi:hypothetical protein
LTQGASRENVITYFGAPASSEKKGEERIELYQFRQGYSGGNKASRALFHGVADVFTLFIWELIAMPTEAIANGNDMTVKVVYDSEDRLKDYVFLSQK